ncbi:MAG: TrpB-like pyridoxal phosphate-dependent enzyme [Deltaproteobacteria bacterium]|nr:TrpB-like pyridoxal phosphate-dependent enzyme [Deltaproteobacteria bacterium]
MESNRIELPAAESIRSWYNVLPDLPKPLDPPLHPGTRQPLGPADLTPLFPMALIEQEMSPVRTIAIPDPILDVLSIWRPTPLVRARRLEAALGTPARIYFKNESVSPAGSHKPNTAVAQAYYNKQEGIRRLATETGAGQWGSSLAFACSTFGMECTVYMVKVSYDAKPYRRSLMRVWGAEVFASPTDKTNSGRAVLAADANSPGSLGIAISEAVEDAANRADTHYALGSVLNHVCLHQTVIGQEAKKQLAIAGERLPDVVIGCCGGGSNFAGIALPFVPDVAAGKKIRLMAVEPASCPTLTRGPYAYDFGDTAGIVPIMKMHTLGHGFVPPSIHAGGLRYHGDSPIVSALVEQGIMEARAYGQVGCFEAAMLFARTEGIVPAPETSHAIKAAVDEAIAAREAGEERVILFNLSGHGFFDMASYDAYLAGKLVDHELPQSSIDKALVELPKVDAA